MRLYYHHFASPTVRKVRAVAFQLDLELDEIKVDYDAREHLAPEYLALNPNAKFPTLVGEQRDRAVSGVARARGWPLAARRRAQ